MQDKIGELKQELPISAKLIANLLSGAGIERILTLRFTFCPNTRFF